MKTGNNGGLLLLEVECLPQQSSGKGIELYCDQAATLNRDNSFVQEEESESISVFDEFISCMLKLLFNVPVT